VTEKYAANTRGMGASSYKFDGKSGRARHWLFQGEAAARVRFVWVQGRFLKDACHGLAPDVVLIDRMTISTLAGNGAARPIRSSSRKIHESFL
jgi:hypothetical protein